MAFGFFLACMATGASLLLLTGIIAPDEVRVAGENDSYTALLIGIFAIASIVAYASALPGLFLVVFAEMQRVRGWLYFTLSGGGVALAAVVLVIAEPAEATRPALELAPVTIVSGMIGGLVYWLIAGRRSGGWLPRQIRRDRMLRAENEEKR